MIYYIVYASAESIFGPRSENIDSFSVMGGWIEGLKVEQFSCEKLTSNAMQQCQLSINGFPASFVPWSIVFIAFLG